MLNSQSDSLLIMSTICLCVQRKVRKPCRRASELHTVSRFSPSVSRHKSCRAAIGGGGCRVNAGMAGAPAGAQASPAVAALGKSIMLDEFLETCIQAFGLWPFLLILFCDFIHFDFFHFTVILGIDNTQVGI